MCVFLRVIYYTVRNASFGVMIRSVCVHEYPPPLLPCMHQIDVLCLSTCTSLTTSSTVVALLFQTILPKVNGCFLSIVLWKEHRSPQNNIQGRFKTKLKPRCFSLGVSNRGKRLSRPNIYNGKRYTALCIDWVSSGWTLSTGGRHFYIVHCKSPLAQVQI